MRGYKFKAKEKEKAVLEFRSGVPQWKVCRHFKCNRDSIRLWNNAYDGTLKSLESKSSANLTPHFNAHTKKETRAIKKVLKDHHDCLQEAWEILRVDFAYSRTYGGFYRYIRKNDLVPKEVREKYIPQEYETPTMIAQKLQMDVKFVPTGCLPKEIRYTEKWFQYTLIDECSREVFKYGYREHSSWSTIDFVRRAIIFFGYKPSMIQTDNGTEFTNPKGKECKKEHALDWLCRKFGIEHKCIRPYTPRHNGKVERVHRNDQQVFYRHHMYDNCFASFEDFCMQLKGWVIRSNNIPSQAIKNAAGKNMMTPNAKRQECLNAIAATDKNELRFVKAAVREKAYTLPEWSSIPKYLQ